MPTARVTVTLPVDIVDTIGRHERNRSAFVLVAVRNELQRRRREQLHRSLRAPHPESRTTAEAGFDAWAKGLPDEDVAGLIDARAGTPVRWVPGKGWVERKR